jgi:tyrosyl-tRNA synthetase
VGASEGVEGAAGNARLFGGWYRALESFGQGGNEARLVAGGAEDEGAAGGFGQKVEAGDEREGDGGEGRGFGVFGGKRREVVKVGGEGVGLSRFRGEAQEMGIGEEEVERGFVGAASGAGIGEGRKAGAGLEGEECSVLVGFERRVGIDGAGGGAVDVEKEERPFCGIHPGKGMGERGPERGAGAAEPKIGVSEIGGYGAIQDFGQDRAVEIWVRAASPHHFRASDPDDLGGKPGKSFGESGLEGFGGLGAGSCEALQFGLAQGAGDGLADLEDRLAIGDEARRNDGRLARSPEGARGPFRTRLQHWLPLVPCLAYRVPRPNLKDKTMTYHPKSDFMAVMITRGFLADCTDYQGLDEVLVKGVVPAYIGFDATAKSLHVGSLIQIMMLRWLQKTGHKPITLMGGGTTKVGDPSFRADERPLLSAEQIDDNIAGIKKVFSAYIRYDESPSGALMLNNAEWLDGLNYLDFLRDIGRHFSINRMLSFESVKSRLDREQSLSFLEFNYMILQAYDFLELNRRYGCLLQMGGSDQWGNIVNGIDLTRRVLDKEIYGLTSPLLTTSDGKKMGKSAAGAIWLNADMLSAYEFWQFWRNTTDADVGRFLKLYTELPVEECERLGALGGSEINGAKIILANEVTTLAHGRAAAEAAEATAREVFEKGGIGDDLPTLTLSADEVGEGISIVQVLVRSGLAASGKEAKRLIADNGARINDEPLTDAGLMLSVVDLGAPVKLSAGKKRHALVQLG